MYKMPKLPEVDGNTLHIWMDFHLFFIPPSNNLQVSIDVQAFSSSNLKFLEVSPRYASRLDSFSLTFHSSLNQFGGFILFSVIFIT